MKSQIVIRSAILEPKGLCMDGKLWESNVIRLGAYANSAFVAAASSA
jgi:hypothetical protein